MALSEKEFVEGESIRVSGLVQGVGFRPTVWRIARQLNLVGYVYNDAAGVVIHLWGRRDLRQLFIKQLQLEQPPLARIEEVICQPLSKPRPSGLFEITESRGGVNKTGIAADAAVCKACIDETLDPASRRYRYPFTNCTHCGPRLSIVKSIPYDRPNTSMDKFPLCKDCLQEYQDPGDRRFHAQPIACPTCGPIVWLEDSNGEELNPCHFDAQDAIGAAVKAIRRGDIVAIKGIGGFHLACDAGNYEAITRLRARKNRPHKPFALMARDLSAVQQYCYVNEAEGELLRSPEAPIVLLKNRRSLQYMLPDILAPALPTLGFMLPYSPLHVLLLDFLDNPLVMTSGNPKGAPQCIGNDDAREKLQGLADYWLMNDRAIVNRVDDSVVRFINQQPQFLRRARGYAPAPVKLPSGFEDTPVVLTLGGELKNTLCLLKNGQAILSQYIGDLEQPPAMLALEQTIDRYLNLFDAKPALLAADLHPEYLSTKLAEQLAADLSLPVERVQHHHAHMAACMADNEVALHSPPMLGIILDGLGWGDDGTIWGGEILLADYQGYQRLGCLKPVPLPGGTQAILQPWRNCFAQLETTLGCDQFIEQFADLELIKFLKKQPLNTLQCMIKLGINSPLSSSCGRLFDGVAAALNLCRDGISYEGQAAIELEAFASVIADDDTSYTFDFESENGLLQLSSISLWQALLLDLQTDTSREVMATRFHHGLANALVTSIMQLWTEQYPRTIVLSGGVFQNKILLVLVTQQLKFAGFGVLHHRQIPSNDGGLSLGQAVVAAARQLALS
jgi:hydrogenase maturation protein HypF